jgi:glycosyltransferase involved in cell wall biosynthesis
VRIGIVAPPWLPVPPIGYGGTECVIDRLARGFAAAGHEVLLVTAGDSTCPVPRFSTWPAAQVDAIGSIVPELRHVLAAYDALAGFDVVHDHTLIGALHALAHPELLVVTTNHGPFDAAANDLYRRIGHRVPVIAISHDQASHATDVPIAAVIHHGLDVETVPFGAGDGGYVLFLGRMCEEKGAHVAAQAARRAGIPLRLAGKLREPAEIEYFHDRVEPLLGRDVEYVGELGAAAKLEALRHAVALVNPIRWPEPFGLVMIEALASGTPVVTFRSGAAPEIVDHGVTGYLCDDADSMLQAIADVGSIDRHACREAAATRFSTARMVRDHEQLFERLARERQRDLDAGPRGNIITAT